MSVEEENSPPFTREKPWYERHSKRVLGGLVALLILVVWFTDRLSDTGRQGAMPPLKAEGLPPVPVQPPNPPLVTETAKLGIPARSDWVGPKDQSSQSTRQDSRTQRRQPPSTQPASNSGHATREFNGRPLVVDSATLVFDSVAICVDGIAGARELAREVNQLLGTDTLSCKGVRQGYFSCKRQSDGKDYAQLMVSSGYASALSSDGPLALSEEFARNAKRGIWGKESPVATRPCSAP